MSAQSTTSTATTLNACVGNQTGVLRSVSGAKDCIRGLETFQQFSIQGPQGAQGPQGPAGPMGIPGMSGAQGPQGPAGVAGAQGPAGALGATGAQGPAGAKGDTGATGAAGPQGQIGLTGAQGATGAIGPVGPQGATGAQGPIGLTGSTGPAGPQGPAGVAGATGPQGATGAQGPVGATGAGFRYRGAYSSSTSYTGGDVVLYNSALYYVSTSAGSTVSGVAPDNGNSFYSLLLPAGATGAQGRDGATGARGATGATGPAGPSGPTGPTGPAGAGSVIHYYQHVGTVPGTGYGTDFGGYEVSNFIESCLPNEMPIAASCGYQIPTAVNDQHNLIVNYSGLEYNQQGAPTGRAQCNVTNTATDARNVLVGISCLATTR